MIGRYAALRFGTNYPLLRNLRPGEVSALGLTEAAEPPISSSEDEQMNDESKWNL